MALEQVRGRIDRTRRNGRIVYWFVVAVSVVLGLPLLHAVLVAVGLGRADLITWGVVGVALLAAMDGVAWLLVRRQERLLDAAEETVREIEMMSPE